MKPSQRKSIRKSVEGAIHSLIDEPNKLHLVNESVFRKELSNELISGDTHITPEQIEFEWNRVDLIIKNTLGTATAIELKYWLYPKSDKSLNGKFHLKGGPGKQNESEAIAVINKCEMLLSKPEIYEVFCIIVWQESLHEKTNGKNSYFKSYGSCTKLKSLEHSTYFEIPTLDELEYFGCRILEMKSNSKKENVLPKKTDKIQSKQSIDTGSTNNHSSPKEKTLIQSNKDKSINLNTTIMKNDKNTFTSNLNLIEKVRDITRKYIEKIALSDKIQVIQCGETRPGTQCHVHLKLRGSSEFSCQLIPAPKKHHPQENTLLSDSEMILSNIENKILEFLQKVNLQPR